MTVQVLQGDAIERLRGLPEGSVHCCVTSPPYWNLRDYRTATWEGGDSACEHGVRRWEGPKQTHGAQSGHASKADRLSRDECQCGARRIDQQIGLEPTPAEWVAKLVALFGEVRRVLRNDATLWINCGSAYASTSTYNAPRTSGGEFGRVNGHRQPNAGIPAEYKPGDRIDLPGMLAEALRADGWFLRDAVVWAKTSPMPESVSGWRWEQHRIKAGKDDAGRTIWRDCPGCAKCSPNDGLVLRKGSWRHTNSYEMVFQFAKTAEYFGDGEGVREKLNPATLEREKYPRPRERENSIGKLNRWGGDDRSGSSESSPAGRNPRNVWTLGPDPLTDEHFAAFPREIPRRAILASTSAKGCCPACGAPWARVVERERVTPVDYNGKHSAMDTQFSGRRMLANVRARREAGNPHDNPFPAPVTTGWRPTCACFDCADCGGWKNPENKPGLCQVCFGAEHKAPTPCTVLDPFAGSGTTGVVADELGRDAILIELSQDYAAMAERRVARARARRMLGDAPRHEPLPGQLGLF